MLQILTCRADLAGRFGVDEAVFLHNIVYWTLKNKAEGRHFHQGRYWTYASRKGLAEMYPFWSESQIKRMTARLRDQGALLSGDFNEDRRLRTSWYSPSDEVLALYGEGPWEAGQNRPMHCPEPASPLDENGQCIYKEEQVESQEVPPVSPKGGKRGRRKQDKSVPAWKPERFEAFWEYYRVHARGEDRQGAAKAWDKLRPDDRLIDEMARALQRQVQSDAWRDGIGIPYAKTWLNNARWKDTPKAAPPAADPYGDEGEDGI